ncbi:MAG: hypothetical protein KDD89_02895 [Anaerolineales bacterium]|nr:hypothetical protein [Anaerolineales bacterium]
MDKDRQRTAVRYWYTDGLPDIGLGIGFWLMTAVLLNFEQLPGLLGRVVALPLTGFAISLLFPWLIRTVRQRWLPEPPLTYAPRPSLRYQLLGMVILVPLVVVLGLLVARLSESTDLASDAPNLFALSVGVLVSFVPLMLGFISGAGRYYLVAVPVILASFWLVVRSPTMPTPGWSVLFVWGLTGLSFLLCGLAALFLFYIRTQYHLTPDT